MLDANTGGGTVEIEGNDRALAKRDKLGADEATGHDGIDSQRRERGCGGDIAGEKEGERGWTHVAST